jgi:methylenetetrahydrofolate dehydrogenase (NADP+)/methenyltetrahydrofolate cyclohydrolase
LPDHIDSEKILLSINPIKDVDGFHPYNLGHLAAGVPTFIPCTPKGIMRFFEHYDYELKGKHVVVVGRSNIVGRPISILTSLKKKYSDATTTICHSGSKNIYNYTKVADIVILAIGSPNFLKAEHIKNGAIVIDVGINRIIDSNGKPILVGDADFTSLKNKVEAITPVPGGVGPMTIAMLVENTVEAAEKLTKHS